MATIDGKEILTVVKDGAIFALECNCIKEDFFEKREGEKTSFNFDTNLPLCQICRMFPWVVSIKEEI